MIYFPSDWSVQTPDFRKSLYFIFSAAVQEFKFIVLQRAGPIIFWNKITKEIFIPWQIPRFKVSVGVFSFCFIFLINYFHTQEISLTQELHSAAGSASKSQSEGGVWTLDIFSHKICELHKYVNYTYICLFFQRNSLHCSKKILPTESWQSTSPCPSRCLWNVSDCSAC